MIGNSYSGFLRALKAEAVAHMPVSVRFFTPNETFWLSLEQFKHIDLIDCGTGLALLPVEAKAKGFNMLGIDLAIQVGDTASIRMDAIDYKFGYRTWPIICRPSHDGWCDEVIRNAKRSKASALYVGLRKNLTHDCYGHVRSAKRIASNVGEEGESLWRLG